MSPLYIVSKEAALAACVGDLPYLAAYLADGHHLINQPTIFQSKLLHIACKAGQFEVAKFLILKGANIAALDYGEILLTGCTSQRNGGDRIDTIRLRLEVSSPLG